MTILPEGYNWKAPVIEPIVRKRIEMLNRIRANPEQIPALKLYYRNNIAQFIVDWGVTADPRNVEVNRPVVMPFILFPRQVEWVDYVIECWRAREDGLTEKSRECGVSWLAVAVACSLSLFHNNMMIGFGSRKEEYVDKIGAPKSLFYKARMFMRYIPPEFRGGWNIAKHAPHMRIEFPSTESVISGEAGDNIGRGDRVAIYFVDEAAYLEHPESIDAALASTTNCRQDISSVNGHANPFAIKRHSGRVKVFTFSWMQDPRKDAEWYAVQERKLDPIVLAQEVGMDYSASVEGVVIPAVWVQAAIDAHIKLKVQPTGIRIASLDIADEGKDKNAFGVRQGILLEHSESWSGKGSDPYATVEKTFLLCDMHNVPGFDYDADGMGASVRGDARKINQARNESKPRVRMLNVNAFRGSAAVTDPERLAIGTERTNEDFFENFKAQAWWALRHRFYVTYQAVVKGESFNPSEIISLSRGIKELPKLCIELSQPVWEPSKSGKMMINKTPEGVASPNLADQVMIAFAPKRPAMVISSAALNAVSQ